MFFLVKIFMTFTIVIDFSKAEKLEDAATDDVIASANKMMDLYDEAFKELAK